MRTKGENTHEVLSVHSWLFTALMITITIIQVVYLKKRQTRH